MLDFLSALFRDKPDNLYVLLWTLPDKLSSWHRDLERLAADAVRLAQTQNVYIGVGLSAKDYGPTRRVPAEEVAGIVGMWADVDIRHPVHSKPNLPPTLEDAIQLIKDIGPEPTILVDTGHGLQAWWLFREPWIFDEPAERQEAKEMAIRWSATLKARAAARGWDVDSVHDLARVLRLPGTYNRKAEPVPVRIVSLDENKRYNPSDLDPYMLEVLPTAQVIADVGELVLDPGAIPPFDKFEVLLENEPKFRQTWERKRRDLQDQSASGYDLALASYAVMAGWTDQEIADLLIAFRRKYGEDLKLRQDYYRRTIAKARSGAMDQQAAERLETALEIVTAAPEEKDNQREAILDGLSRVLKVRITGVTKYLTEPPRYKLSTDRGEIMLGGVERLIGQTAFRNAIAATTGVLIPPISKDQWHKVAQALLNACEEVAVGTEGTDVGICQGWLAGYLAERRPLEDVAEAIDSGYPFQRDGAVYITLAALRKWLALTQGEKVSAKELGALLRRAGCVPEVIGLEINGRRTTRNVWRLPEAISHEAVYS